MRKQRKPVLDEREMLDMYRVEHAGLWLMIALLCGAVLVQLLCGAPLAQMAGELLVLVTVSVVMIVANVRHGVWDENARPSVRGNASCAVLAGVGVAAVLFALGRRAALPAGLLAGALCFLLLTVLMRCMQRRQQKLNDELDKE